MEGEQVELETRLVEEGCEVSRRTIERDLHALSARFQCTKSRCMKDVLVQAGADVSARQPELAVLAARFGEYGCGTIWPRIMWLVV
jgi:arginine repressor